jgi:hypothetical protein
MEMQPLPGSGGFSQQYPVAVSSGMPRPTYLRPLQQPLYDTETMPVAGRTELTFFQRALSQTMAFAATVKSAAETNLNQSGALAQPQQFLIAGFTIEVESAVSKADFDLLYTTSVFTFTFSGNRTYLQIPTSQMPQGVVPTGFAATTVGATTIASVANGTGLVNNIYKMTVGKNALQIMPTENFGARLNWPNGAPNVAVATRMRCFIRGLLFNSI